jgi:hypothetical protein
MLSKSFLSESAVPSKIVGSFSSKFSRHNVVNGALCWICYIARNEKMAVNYEKGTDRGLF